MTCALVGKKNIPVKFCVNIISAEMANHISLGVMKWKAMYLGHAKLYKF